MSPPYNASKAFLSNYLQGLRHRAAKRCPGVVVTDVKPGYVSTSMTSGNPGMFWVTSAAEAAEQIFRA